jgi:pimeloyl-ACP methyl ester carboxylesterase
MRRVVIAALFTVAVDPSASRAQPRVDSSRTTSVAGRARQLTLAPCQVAGVPEQVRCGVLEVYENREAGAGRRLSLNIVVLPSRAAEPAADPIVFLAGGPGQAATTQAARQWRSPLRDSRDIVLVDQRGTGGSHALDCSLGSADDPQQFFEPLFEVPRFASCRARLEQRADLTQYTTAAAMDDLDDARQALGYAQVTLVGQSYDTRAALTYARRHPRHVRAAVLTGLVPPSFRNPLHHASSAQEALDRLLGACEREPDCHAAFPGLRAELDTIVRRLDRAPARVLVAKPAGGGDATVSLSRTAFAEAVRVMMYGDNGIRNLPLLLHHAFLGDFTPFAEQGLAANRGLRTSLRIGLLMSVVCSEDVPRITEADIVHETRNTLLGASRVREQIAACAVWPRATPPAHASEPVSVDVPMLLVTGALDPVTPPRWGEETARHLPNSLHLVVPGGHGPASPCLDGIVRQFVASASVRGLDTGCLATLALPAFALPVASERNGTPH